MKLAPQQPAEGILKQSDWGDAKSYRVACECTDANHSHDLWVEADDTNSISVTIYTTTKSKWWKLNRWQTMWTLLTRGYVECETSLILTQQQALNYAETLRSAVKDVEEFKKNVQS